MNLIKIYSVVLLLFLLCIGVEVESQSTETILKELKISTTRIEADQYETGKDITIIDSKKIESLGVTSIDQLLRYVQGVEVQPRGPFGVQSDISIRASTFSQVIILIDGMKLNDPLTGHFNSNIPIPVYQIDHIEILRGPASAQFGADAVGGVINIITKTRSDAQTKSHSNLDVSAGDYSYYASKFNSFQKGKKADFDLGIEGSYSKGPKPQGVNNSFDVITGSGAIALKIGKSSALYYRTAFDSRDFAAKYFYTKSKADNASEITQNAWNQLAFNTKGKKTNTQIDVVWRYNYDNYKFNAASKANVHYTNFYNLQAYQNLSLGKVWKLNYGFQGDIKTIKSNDRGNHKNYHVGVFVGMVIKPIKSFIINFNHRLDYDQNYKLVYTPQLSLVYNHKRFTLRVNGGESVRAADFTERYISSNLAGPLSAGRNLGNADLRTEKFWSVDGGVDIKPTKGIVFSLTGFSRWGQNQIDYEITNSASLTQFDNLKPNSNYYFAQNIKSVNTSGFEAGFNVEQEIGKKGMLYVNAGYIYAFSKMSSGKITKYISNHARHLVTLNTFYKISWFNIGISGLYKYKLPEAVTSLPLTSNTYMIFNARFGVNVFKNKISINANIDNLFNKNYTEVLGAVQPGRWAYFTLSYRF